MIATDHAPHTIEEKTRDDIWTVDCGFPGVETQMPLMLTAIAKGHGTVRDYVRWSAENPARAFGLFPRKGALIVGSDADLAIVDLARPLDNRRRLDPIARQNLALARLARNGAADPHSGARPLRHAGQGAANGGARDRSVRSRHPGHAAGRTEELRQHDGGDYHGREDSVTQAARHILMPSPETVHWGYFDAALAPVLEIDPGDIVTVGSVSGSPDETPKEGAFVVRAALKSIHAAVERQLGPHILTGPIAVRGAEPGDALRIEILDIALADDWGFNLIKPDLGALPALFPYDALDPFGDRQGSGPDQRALWRRHPGAAVLRRDGNRAGRPPRAESPRSFPAASAATSTTRSLSPAPSSTLPVAAPGGLLSIGDGHAAQGDGEVCLTAVETGLTGALRIELVKRADLDAPFAETPSHLIAMAFDESLDVAAELALRRMIGLIEQRTRLSAEDAYRLCSLAGDLRVTQVVNRKKGVHMMMPLPLLAAGPCDNCCDEGTSAMSQRSIKAIAVFCGSNFGATRRFRAGAAELGAALAKAGIASSTAEPRRA